MDFSGEDRGSDLTVHEWRGGALAGRDQLVLGLLPLARRVARRYAGGPERLDDLEQVAIVGAVKAVSRFDPDRGTPLAQFAVPFIHGELRHHLRDNLGLPRGPRARQSDAAKVIRAARAISGRLGRPARADEVAAETGLTDDEARATMELAEAQRTTSLNAGHEAESSAPLDALARDDEGLEAVERRHWLSRILGSLDGRERSLLFLRLGAGRSRREAARALGLSPAQESRLFRRALDKARAVAAALDGP
ncbi:MAG: sigma-70 family RNA polymerase sigma factor [Solirubrobacterales bacterium]